jgi:hypothetical protein
VQRSDSRKALLALAVLLAGSTVASWQRWANPIVDCGREMYVPWRIAEGDVLYRDLFFVYGPFVPYWHAALFRLFGPHLDVLYACGLAVGWAHVLVVFALGRRITSAGLAALAAALVAVEFVFHPSVDNLVFPYSFNASYASLANLVAAWCLLTSDECRRRGAVVAAALAVAVSCLSRQEFGIAGVTFFAAYTLTALRRAAPPIRRTVVGTLAAIAAVVVTGYAWFAYRAGVHLLVEETLWPRRMLTAMGGFERDMVGTTLEPGLIVGLVGRGVAMLSGALALVMLAYLAERTVRGLGGLLLLLIVLGIAASPAAPAAAAFLYRGLFHLTNPLVLVTAAIIVAAADVPRRREVSWIVLLAVLQTWRSPLFGGVAVYSAFYMPAGVIVLIWLVGEALPTLGRTADPDAWRRATSVVGAVWCAFALLVTVRVFRGELTERVGTERGTLYVAPAIRPAFVDLLDLVRSSTHADEPVLLLPEDNAVHFLAARRSIHRYYQLIPGILDAEGEARVIRSSEHEHVRFVSISNRMTADYGSPFFGVDYDREILRWVQSEFPQTRRLGSPSRPVAAARADLMFPEDGYGVDVYMRP